MERVKVQPRQDWERILESQGCLYHSLGGPYWSENVGYRFSKREVQELEDATNVLHDMCLRAADYAVQNDRLAQFGVPEKFRDMIAESWRAQGPTIYGRFDLRYDGRSPPKLFEYNADTPTSLLEASRLQERWRADLFGTDGQFNTIEEQLIAAWQRVAAQHPVVYFSSVSGHSEDMGNVIFMRDMAARAGIDARFLFVEEVQWNPYERRFETQYGDVISTWFKLYPWEWIFDDQYGEHIQVSSITCVEPAGKVLLSSKAIPPILWELFPDHPNLLPAYFDAEKFGSSYVKKPVFGREGSNISIVQDGKIRSSVDGPYGSYPAVYQAVCTLPQFSQMYTLVGSWVIAGKAAGIGIRESVSMISENRSRFLPHVVQ
jgi:glutathionylspermidine synthase